MEKSNDNSDYKLILNEDYSVDLYLELGHDAASIGNIEEAKNWYSIGLKISQKNNDFISEKEFSKYIFTLL